MEGVGNKIDSDSIYSKSFLDDLDDVTLTYILIVVCCCCTVLLALTAIYQYISAILKPHHKHCSLSKTFDPTLNESTSTKIQSDTLKENDECKDEECPLCLDEVTIPAQTCCAHTFCAECISRCLNHNSRVVAMKCPVCRHMVASFILLNKEQFTNQSSADTVSIIENYNKRFSGQPRKFLDYLHDSPYILIHLILYLFTNQGLFWMSAVKFILVVSLMLLMMLSPWQLFSDNIYDYFDKLIALFTMSFALIHVIVVVKHIFFNNP